MRPVPAVVQVVTLNLALFRTPSTIDGNLEHVVAVFAVIDDAVAAETLLLDARTEHTVLAFRTGFCAELH